MSKKPNELVLVPLFDSMMATEYDPFCFRFKGAAEKQRDDAEKAEAIRKDLEARGIDPRSFFRKKRTNASNNKRKGRSNPNNRYTRRQTDS